MPTILRFDGLRVVIYPNGHRSAHVHVLGAGGEAVFVLNCPHGPPELRENFGFGLTKLREIERFLAGGLPGLCAELRVRHGGF